MNPIMKTSRALWLGLLGVIASLFSFYLLGYDTTTLTLQVLVLGVAITVSVSWLPAAVRAFINIAASAADKVTIAVWSFWTVLAFQRVYALYLTVLQRPDWLVYSPISTVITTLIIVSGTYAAYATVGEVETPHQDRTWVLISTFIGGLVAGVFGAFLIIDGIHQLAS